MADQPRTNTQTGKAAGKFTSGTLNKPFNKTAPVKKANGRPNTSTKATVTAKPRLQSTMFAPPIPVNLPSLKKEGSSTSILIPSASPKLSSSPKAWDKNSSDGSWANKLSSSQVSVETHIAASISISLDEPISKDIKAPGIISKKTEIRGSSSQGPDPRNDVGAWKQQTSDREVNENEDSTWIDDSEMDFSAIPVFEDGIGLTPDHSHAPSAEMEKSKENDEIEYQDLEKNSPPVLIDEFSFNRSQTKPSNRNLIDFNNEHHRDFHHSLPSSNRRHQERPLPRQHPSYHQEDTHHYPPQRGQVKQQYHDPFRPRESNHHRQPHVDGNRRFEENNSWGQPGRRFEENSSWGHSNKRFEENNSWGGSNKMSEEHGDRNHHLSHHLDRRFERNQNNSFVEPQSKPADVVRSWRDVAQPLPRVAPPRMSPPSSHNDLPKPAEPVKILKHDEKSVGEVSVEKENPQMQELVSSEKASERSGKQHTQAEEIVSEKSVERQSAQPSSNNSNQLSEQQEHYHQPPQHTVHRHPQPMHTFNHKSPDQHHQSFKNSSSNISKNEFEHTKKASEPKLEDFDDVMSSIKKCLTIAAKKAAVAEVAVEDKEEEEAKTVDQPKVVSKAKSKCDSVDNWRDYPESVENPKSSPPVEDPKSPPPVFETATIATVTVSVISPSEKLETEKPEKEKTKKELKKEKTKELFREKKERERKKKKEQKEEKERAKKKEKENENEKEALAKSSTSVPEPREVYNVNKPKAAAVVTAKEVPKAFEISIPSGIDLSKKPNFFVVDEQEEIGLDESQSIIQPPPQLEMMIPNNNHFGYSQMQPMHPPWYGIAHSAHPIHPQAHPMHLWHGPPPPNDFQQQQPFLHIHPQYPPQQNWISMPTWDDIPPPLDPVNPGSSTTSSNRDGNEINLEVRPILEKKEIVDTTRFRQFNRGGGRGGKYYHHNNKNNNWRGRGGYGGQGKKEDAGK